MEYAERYVSYRSEVQRGDRMNDRQLQPQQTEGLPKDEFDRMMGALDGIPGATVTRPSTTMTTHPILGITTNWTTHTVRVPEIGDTIFVQFQDARGGLRFVIPPKVAEAIARQRDSLTGMTRKRVAKRIAAERKAAGKKPGFKMTPAERREARARRAKQ